MSDDDDDDNSDEENNPRIPEINSPDTSLMDKNDLKLRSSKTELGNLPKFLFQREIGYKNGKLNKVAIEKMLIK